MTRKYAVSARVLCGAFLANVAFAQKATTLEQAELAGLTPQKRAEVEQRASQPGQPVTEVLTRHPVNGWPNGRGQFRYDDPRDQIGASTNTASAQQTMTFGSISQSTESREKATAQQD